MGLGTVGSSAQRSVATSDALERTGIVNGHAAVSHVQIHLRKHAICQPCARPGHLPKHTVEDAEAAQLPAHVCVMEHRPADEEVCQLEISRVGPEAPAAGLELAVDVDVGRGRWAVVRKGHRVPEHREQERV